MAKISSKAKGTGRTATTVAKTINKAGGEAFQLNDRWALMTAVLTSFFGESKYYGSTDNDIVRLATSLSKTDPEFVARLAVYARREFHLRTVSQVLTAIVAKNATGNPIIRKMTRNVIERPDDMVEIIAYHLKAYGERKKNPIPRSLRRGLADVFPTFTKYHLGKYKCEDKDVKLKDVLKICRPTPKDDAQAADWKALIEGRLETPVTVATELSDKGQSKEVWEKLINDKSLGYMALLRNLKNMIEQNVSRETFDKVLKILEDPKRVAESKQLPFRYFSAYKMVQGLGANVLVRPTLATLERAITLSAKNIPNLPGVTLFTADESGSMQSPLSAKSMVQYIDVGNLLMALANKFCDNAICSSFGTYFKILNVNQNGSIFDNMKTFADSVNEVQMGTDLTQMLRNIIKNKTYVDRIVIFSDMQSWIRNGCNTLLSQYKQEVNAKVKVYSIDLAGHGTTLFAQDGVSTIAGWSEKVFDFISFSEGAGTNLLDRIQNYSLD